MRHSFMWCAYGAWRGPNLITDGSLQAEFMETKYNKHVSLDILGWYWKWGSLTLTFKVILTILTQNSSKFGLSVQ